MEFSLNRQVRGSRKASYFSARSFLIHPHNYSPELLHELVPSLWYIIQLCNHSVIKYTGTLTGKFLEEEQRNLGRKKCANLDFACLNQQILIFKEIEKQSMRNYNLPISNLERVSQSHFSFGFYSQSKFLSSTIKSRLCKRLQVPNQSNNRKSDISF